MPRSRTSLNDSLEEPQRKSKQVIRAKEMEEVGKSFIMSAEQQPPAPDVMETSAVALPLPVDEEESTVSTVRGDRSCDGGKDNSNLGEISTVTVAVRIRPLIPREVAEQCVSCLKAAAHNNNSDSIVHSRTEENYAKAVCPTEVQIGHDRRFTFNNVLPELYMQEDVWNCCNVQGLVDSCFEGYNATILAYGQTGSGKTYTMGMGDAVGSTPQNELGIVPRAIERIFDRVEAEKEKDSTNEGDILVRVSYVEIIQEQLRDLLLPQGAENRGDSARKNGRALKPKRGSTSGPTISIHDDGRGNVKVSGCRVVTVRSAEELHEQLFRGSLARTTGSTLMNMDSSRSHAIFTISIDKLIPGVDAEDANTRLRENGNGKRDNRRTRVSRLSSKDKSPARFSSGKLHLVDLAGAERQKRTGATGKRFKESVRINQGLLALGNVISALGDEKKRVRVERRGGKVHVPYRESKLTRLLQDSLGGNAHTLMIACVSPADNSFEETLNVLRYANRAKNIQNRPLVNVEEEAQKVREIAALMNGDGGHHEDEEDDDNEDGESNRGDGGDEDGTRSWEEDEKQGNDNEGHLMRTDTHGIFPSRSAMEMEIEIEERANSLAEDLAAERTRNLKEELRKIREELSEAQDDLRRDEQIFAAKMEEFAACQQSEHDLRTSNHALQREVVQLREAAEEQRVRFEQQLLFNMKEGIKEKKEAILQAKEEARAEAGARVNSIAERCDNAVQTNQEIAPANTSVDASAKTMQTTSTVYVQTDCTISADAVPSSSSEEKKYILGASEPFQVIEEDIPLSTEDDIENKEGVDEEDSYAKGFKIEVVEFPSRATVGLQSAVEGPGGLENDDSQSLMQIGSVVPKRSPDCSMVSEKKTMNLAVAQNQSMESDYCIYNDSCNVSAISNSNQLHQGQQSLVPKTPMRGTFTQGLKSNVPHLPPIGTHTPLSVLRASLRTSGCIPEVVEDEEHDGTTEPEDSADLDVDAEECESDLRMGQRTNTRNADRWTKREESRHSVRESERTGTCSDGKTGKRGSQSYENSLRLSRANASSDSLDMRSFYLNHDSMQDDGNNEADSGEDTVMGANADDEVSILIEDAVNQYVAQVEVQRKLARDMRRLDEIDEQRREARKEVQKLRESLQAQRMFRLSKKGETLHDGSVDEHEGSATRDMLEPPASHRPNTASSGATTQEEGGESMQFKELENEPSGFLDQQHGNTTIESTILEDSAMELVSRSYMSVASLLDGDGQDISSSRIYDEDEDDSMIDQEERQALASMRRVEERLDALDAEAEYKGASVNHLKEELQKSLRKAPMLFRANSWHESTANCDENGSVSQPLDAEEEAVVKRDPTLKSVFDHLGMLTPTEARSLLRRCCIRVAEMKEAARRHEVECKMQTEVISECRVELSKARSKLSIMTE